MTPADAALSSLRPASWASTRARSASPEDAASRKWRTAVFSADLTDLLRSCAFLFCRLRLIWDLMFATKAGLGVSSSWDGAGRVVRSLRTQCAPDAHATVEIISARWERPNQRPDSLPASTSAEPAPRGVAEPPLVLPEVRRRPG